MLVLLLPAGGTEIVVLDPPPTTTTPLVPIRIVCVPPTTIVVGAESGIVDPEMTSWDGFSVAAPPGIVTGGGVGFVVGGMTIVLPARTVVIGVDAGVRVNVWPFMTVVSGAAAPGCGVVPAAGMVIVWPARTVLLGVAAGVSVNVWPLITVVIGVAAFPAAGMVTV